MGLNRNLGQLTEVITESGGNIDIKGAVKLSNPIGSSIIYGFGSNNDWGLGEDTGQATRDFNLYNYNRASIELSVNRVSGNIGIGEVNASNKLSVVGPSLGNMIKWTDNINNTGFLGIRNLGVSVGSDDDLIFETGGTAKVRVFKNGNVFVGTSPVDNGNKFRVNGIISSGTPASLQGQITLFSTTANAEGNIYGRTGGGMLFNTNANAHPIEFGGSFVRFNPKVGIGWSNPAYNLQVLGNCAIGMNTNGTATIDAFNGTAFFGNGGTSTCLGIYNNGNYYFTGSNVSDIRAKNNIQDLEINSLQKVLELKPKSYNMNNNPDKIRYGFIAQDVYKIIPELIDGDVEGEDFIGIDYNGIIPILVGAIKELKEEIEILKQNK